VVKVTGAVSSSARFSIVTDASCRSYITTIAPNSEAARLRAEVRGSSLILGPLGSADGRAGNDRERSVKIGRMNGR
jgi:hypothetical protein